MKQNRYAETYLTPLEKKSIGLVLIGTFLEYFDLTLYVHLAVVLNPIFFPPGDPWTAGLFGVFTFSSAYVLRPVGAFVFGYVGDKVGRKASIVWTSGMMGATALTLACLPTYSSIGITASILFIFARALQGFSSIGEIVGAQVFIAEVVEKSRYAHFLSVLPAFMMGVGSAVALGLGFFCLKLDPVSGWRWPFFFGVTVAIVGGFIRLNAIESPVFLTVQKKKERLAKEETQQFFELASFRKTNYWCYFGIELIPPLAFYFAMRYCADFLKDMGLSPTQIISHNSGVILIMLAFTLLMGWLTLSYDPLTLLKRRLLLGLCLIPLLLWSLAGFPSEETVFIVQAFLFSLFAVGSLPAQFKIIRSFPVLGRCTNLGSAFAISHAAMYVITSSLVFFLDQTFGIWGVGSLFILTAATALFCAHHLTLSDQTLSDALSPSNLEEKVALV